MRASAIFLTTGCLFFSAIPTLAEPLRIATFDVDVSPPIGSPVAYAPARKILDPLRARGIVILTDRKPIVLCAIDWIGIANGGHDEFRRRLARAAGTSADRVAVHVLHQHDGPRCDFTAETLAAQRGLGGKLFSPVFARETIENIAAAIRAAIKKPQVVTHLGVGRAKIEKVASNRRILGPDGKVAIVRWSSTTDPRAIAAPEGLIDPYVRLVSFYHDEKPLAVLSYYATHPQSYYGQGDVTSEFVGLARAARQKATGGVLHVHFNGAGGNIAAGKYNDGSTRMRPILAQRMAEGMRKAWLATKRIRIEAKDVTWRSRKVSLPVGKHLVAEELRKTLDDPQATEAARLAAARNLAWVQRMAGGHKIDLGCLRLADTYILHMPGELFVEYQLAAQKLKPKANVCMAAYGDYGPGYIGTRVAYPQGGYETSPRASRVAPEVEAVLMAAIKELLGLRPENCFSVAPAGERRPSGRR